MNRKIIIWQQKLLIAVSGLILTYGCLASEGHAGAPTPPPESTGFRPNETFQPPQVINPGSDQLDELNPALVKLASGEPRDLIRCFQDTPAGRLHCGVLDASKDPSPSFTYKIKLPLSAKDRQVTITDLKEKYIPDGILLRENSKGEFVSSDLGGLNPILSIKIEWNNAPECRIDPLWTHNISLSLMKDGIKMAQLKVVPGFNSYGLDLRKLNAWQVTDNRDVSGFLSAKFSVGDDFQGNEVLYGPIPSYCKMLLTSSIVFDVEALRTSLSMLRFYFDISTDMVSYAHVMNSKYLVATENTICLLYDIWDVLQQYEPTELDLWSLSSQSLISKTIKNAVDEDIVPEASVPAIGTGSEKVLDYWGYFTQTLPSLQKRCEPHDGKSFSRKVSPDSFPVGSDGWTNAKIYLREVQNRERIIQAASAILVLSRSQLDFLKENSWIADPDPYPYLGL